MAFFMLTTTVATANDLQGKIEGKDVPDVGSNANKADEPPPLRFDQMPQTAGVGVPSKWTSYAEQARTQLMELVKSKLDASINSGTTKREINLSIAIWVGQDGRIGRVRFDSSSGDPTTDTMIDKEIRTRLILAPPPSDMPQPLKYNLAYRGQRNPLPLSAAPRTNLR